MKPIVMLVVVASFFLTACGNNTNVNPPYPPEPPSKPALEYLTELSEQGDIFSAAVLQTGILDELEPNTVVTMFTPPVAWFEQEGVTKEAFLAQPQLEKIVTYHVLTSRLGDLAIPFEPDTQFQHYKGKASA